MDELRRPARAKVNPFLRVLGPRDDGFHEVETLIVRVPPEDEVTVRAAEELTLRVRGPRAEGVPPGDDNLALRAAGELRRRCPGASGAAIDLVKRIPVAAGMGGGSADAAATLLVAAELWGCADGAMVREVAALIGSDVPALLEEGPVVARGRGERVDGATVRLSGTRWLTVPADFGIRSADAYRWWDEDGGPTGPDPGPLLSALERGEASRAGGDMFNDLEGPILRRHPGLLDTKRRLLEAGAHGAVVSASGPTIVALVPEAFPAERFGERASKSWPRTIRTSTSGAKVRRPAIRRGARGPAGR